MPESRVTVSEKQLAAAIAGWLRHVPKRVWEQFIEHKILEHYKRTSMEAKRLDGEIADHIAAEMVRLDWQVTHPEPKHLGSPPPWSGEQAAPKRDAS